LKGKIPALLSNMWGIFRNCWRELVLTSVVYKVLAFTILTPLLGSLYSSLLWMSGIDVLADEDILYFFLGPAGWVSAVVAASAAATVVVSEQAALLAILGAGWEGQRVRPFEALRFAARQAWPLLRFTTRCVLIVLAIVAPFAGLIGLVYVGLLSRFDINYYLQQQPPEFLAAVAIAGFLVVVLSLILVRLILKWVFALPLLIFEEVTPRQALRKSAQRTRGKGLAILFRLAVWAFLSLALASLVSAPVGIVGRWLIPLLSHSLNGVLIGVGILLVALFVSNVFASVITSIAFSFALFGLYRPWARVSPDRISSMTLEKPRTLRILSQLTATSAVLILAGFLLVAAVFGSLAMNSIRFEDHTIVTAHRGASETAPENTLAAIRQAIEDGADFVEIDVQETADGHVIVFHDSDFKKVANLDLKIWDAKLSDLQHIDVGSHYSSRFKGERVPTLEQVLLECKARIGVNIEFKSYGHDQDLERRVIDLVERHEMEKEIVLMSLKRASVRRAKALRPDWKVGLLTGVAIGNLARLDVDFLAVHVGLANWKLIRSAHESGKEVAVWTVNDPITMSTLISRGVDNLITDKPALARRVLEMRKELSSAERLLIELAELFGAVPEYDLDIEDF